MIIYYFDEIFAIANIKTSLFKSELKRHSHHFFVVSFCFDSKIKIYGDKTEHEYAYFMIDNDIKHHFELSSERNFSFFIRPESIFVKKIREIYKINGNITEISIQNNIIESIKEISEKEQKIEEVIKLYYNIMEILLPEKYEVIKKADERIAGIKKYIENNEIENIIIRELAEKVYLSESRLTHLFTEETGISLKKYLLDIKLINALKRILEGNSFTSSAYDGGFSDSAHFSRTFKNTFGISVSEIFKNKDNIKIIKK